MRTATLLLLLTVLAGCGSTAHAPRRHRHRPAPLHVVPTFDANQPNIVFVLTDDLSSDLVRYMPAVHALARRGATFTHYIVDDSLCCPSRASIFTGRLPHTTGVFTNIPPDGGYYAWKRYQNTRHSFALRLRRQGYRMALYGKFLNGYRGDHGPIPPGWTDWAATSKGYDEFNYTLSEDGRPRAYGSAPGDYLTDVIGRKAEGLVDAAAPRARPFFLELAPFVPHRPAVPAPRDVTRYADARAPRDAAYNHQDPAAPRWLAHRAPFSPLVIARIDHDYRQRVRSVLAVNELMVRLENRLRALGELQNTYFIFSSDNGYHMGEHRLLPGKYTAFDTDVRVPLIVAGPGIAPGSRIGALTQNTDLAPTFAAMAGAPPDATADGRSLLGLLHGRPVPRDWRRAALIEHHHPAHARRDPDRQSGESGDPPTYAALRTHHLTYVEYVDGERELYDVRTDPAQIHNRYPQLTRRFKRRLHRRLLRLTACHGAAQCATS